MNDVEPSSFCGICDRPCDDNPPDWHEGRCYDCACKIAREKMLRSVGEMVDQYGDTLFLRAVTTYYERLAREEGRREVNVTMERVGTLWRIACDLNKLAEDSEKL